MELFMVYQTKVESIDPGDNVALKSSNLDQEPFMGFKKPVRTL